MGGLAAGWAALGLDGLLVAATTGGSQPPVDGMVLVYSVIGTALGAVAWLALIPARAFDSGTVEGSESRLAHSPGAAALGLPFAGLYGLPIFERLFDAASVRLGTAGGERLASWLVGLAGIAALALLVWILERLARRPGDGSASTAGGSWGLALGLAGFMTATGLAINRNLVGHPLAPEALLADLAVIGAGCGLAWACRGHGRRGRWGMAAAAVALLALAGFGLERVQFSWSTDDERAPAPSGGAPNLILLVIDTLRADVFEAVLEETDEGRAFARHFADGVLFERALAAAPWTAPSMGSILTGLYPSEHGFGALPEEWDPNRTLQPLAANVPTIASRLSQRGYATEAIIANPILFPGSGIDRGFDRYEVLDSTIKKMPLLMVVARLGFLRAADYQQASLVTRRLEGRLDALANAGRPFFLWVHYLDPHEPIFDHPQLGPDPAAAGLGEVERRYRDEVRFTLIHLGRAIEALDERGLWQDSLTVLVSDHGEMFRSDGHTTPVKNPETGDYLRHGHGKALYGSLVRIPLVIRPPGGLATGVDSDGPARVGIMTSHLDLHDTVAEILDVDIPLLGRDRRSLAPWLGKPPPTDAATGQARRAQRRGWALLGGIQAGIPQRGLVTEKRKLLIYERDKPPELYDLERDPGERHNLADRRPRHLEHWIAELESRWAELHHLDTKEAASDLDPETRKRLEALGYLQ